MKIGIHNSIGSFSEYWISYCKINNLPYKLVNCYSNDIIYNLEDCDALFWHFSQNDPKAFLFAKQLLYSIEASGKFVFPNYNTVWHFDDKIGQKYLLESIGAPLVPTWIFYDKQEALIWAKDTNFPKVFKLKGGAGSQNVKLIKNYREARSYIHKAFRCGFPAYDPFAGLLERWRKYKLGKTNFMDIIEGLARFLILPPYARMRGRDKGYIYLQEYVPDNDHDIRVIVIGHRAFAIKRKVRKNDFRASGSGDIDYRHDNIQNDLLELSFELSKKLKSQCIAFDFLRHEEKPVIVEISYGFMPEGYNDCEGYWDIDLIWHEGKFDPYGWMIDEALKVK